MGLMDVLNQAEIDALLSAGEEDAFAGTEADSNGIELYDFVAQDRIVRGRMPALELVNERFARNFRVSLFGLLRRSPDVDVENIKVMKYGEYIHTLYLPTSLNTIKMHPFKGNALLVLDAKLVFILVENFFGGEGRFYTKIEGREFTPTETRVIELTRELIFKDLVESWKLISEIKFERVGTEINPAMANFINPNEVVVVSSFRIELEGGDGEIHLTIPYSMLEPVRDMLHSGMRGDFEDRDERWINALQRELLTAPVRLSCTLMKKIMSLREINDLKTGDIIPFDMPEEVPLYAAGIPSFKGKVGTSNGQYAIKVNHKISKE